MEKALGSAITAMGMRKDVPSRFFLYDMALLKKNAVEMKQAFPPSTLNAVALKGCPVASVLKFLKEYGVGAECASFSEVAIALQCGFAASTILFDSPCKSMRDIERGLEAGVIINADNLDEVQRIASALETIKSTSQIGIRVNMAIGAGTIAMSSTSTADSRFGFPVKGAEDELMAAFDKYKFLTGLHAHIGSQGCDPAMLVQGADSLVQLARRINSHTTPDRIKLIDIGGGLSVDYSGPVSGDNREAFAGAAGGKELSYEEYSSQLRKVGLFDGPWTVATEFGRRTFAHSAVLAAKVEYIKQSGGTTHLTCNAGADVLTRAVYIPDRWSLHAITVHSPTGQKKVGNPSVVTIGGPLCFSTDYIAKKRSLDTTVEAGDWIVLHDAGAYAISHYTRYCSEPAPPVFGFSDDQLKVLWEGETTEDVVKWWC